MRSLDKVMIKGFKSIRDLDLEFRNLNILIGANGAGKSNLISFFKLLNEIVENRLQVHVRQKAGANSFLHYGRKKTQRIETCLDFGANAYKFKLIPTDDNSLIFEEETLVFKGVFYPTQTKNALGSGHQETQIHQQLKKSGPRSIADFVLKSLSNWRVYHFHDTGDSAPTKQPCEINDNMFLRGDGSNLPAFLYLLKTNHPKHYQSIRETIQMVTPFFDDFILRPNPQAKNQIQLEWKETGSDFPFRASHLSDGTLRFICLTTLLLQPQLPSLILIDEPELGLHPYAIHVLGELIRSASEKTQLLISTQSVTFINHFDPEHVIVADRRDGQSTFQRLDESKIEDWMKEYSIGELWEKNTFGGRPQNEKN